MYNFFEIVPSDTKLKHTGDIISFCSSSKYKIFFYSNGVAQIYYDDWDSTTFYIKDEIKYCTVPEGCNIFFTLFQGTISDKATLKLFNISKYPRKTPSLVCETDFEDMGEVTTINIFKCLDTELCIAIGLQSGDILLHKSPLKDIFPKAFRCINVCSKPIKGIDFSQYDEKINLFTCTDEGVFHYVLLSDKFLNETKIFLDDIVSPVHCCTLQPISDLNSEQYFVVARDDGLYCYTREGRGPCYALNGQKKAVEWFKKKYIIVLNVVKSWKIQDNDTFQIVIIDVDSKIIVLNKELCNVIGIQTICGIPSCLIFMKNGDVMTLKEKGMRYKIKHLIRKNMYDMALKLLEESNVYHDILADVLVSYGDHLLQRGDMMGAVKMYSKTIGAISSFTIVNKLSDFRYNECLIEYLSLLKSTEFKSAEHKNLLKNCLQRVELPNRAFNIFDQTHNGHEKLLDCLDTERGEKDASLLAAFEHNRNIITYIKMLSNEEVIDFFFKFGYFLIKQYPSKFNETARYLFTENYGAIQHKIHKYILPLLLLNKMFVTNLIEDLCSYKKKFLYNIWTDLSLQMWQKGNVNIEFLINFFRLSEEQIFIDNSFVICRIYDFWPGIRLMYEKIGVQILSIRSLAKCFEMYPLCMNDFSNEYSYHYNHVWIRSLQKDGFLLNYSYNIISEVFKKIIKTNPYNILNIVGGFMTSNNIFVSHLNDLFLDDSIFQYFKRNELSKRVRRLEEKVSITKNLLHKYNNQPIEFRSRSCEVCKQMTKLPKIYFLCQHSFHKECIKQYSDSLQCLICCNNRKSNLKVKPCIELKNGQYKSDKVPLVQNISQKIENSVLNINSSLHIRCFSKNMNCNLKLECSKSDKNFDNNLNPFIVK